MTTESDVQTVLALEAPVRALLAALGAAKPAIDRLSESRYPDVGYLAEKLEEADLDKVEELIRMVRDARGDQAAFDYLLNVEYYEMTVRAVVDDMDEVDRKRAFLLYAASVA